MNRKVFWPNHPLFAFGGVSVVAASPLLNLLLHPTHASFIFPFVLGTLLGISIWYSGRVEITDDFIKVGLLQKIKRFGARISEVNSNLKLSRGLTITQQDLKKSVSILAVHFKDTRYEEIKRILGYREN